MSQQQSITSIQANNKALAQVWAKTKSKSLSVASIAEEDRREQTARVLQNQVELGGRAYTAIAEEQFGGQAMDLGNIGGVSVNGQGTPTPDSNSYQYAPIELAVQRRAMANLFAFNLVGVQAMNGPVGLAYAVRFFYDTKDGSKIESGFENVGRFAGWSGMSGLANQTNSVSRINATADVGGVTGQEIIDDLRALPTGESIKLLIGKDGKWLKTWTGSVSGNTYTSATAVVGLTIGTYGKAMPAIEAEKLGFWVPSNSINDEAIPADPARTNWYDADPASPLYDAKMGQPISAIRQVKMGWDKKSIEAETRMLGASFSLQTDMDIRKIHGLEVGRMMVNHLVYEQGAEVDRELLWRCKNTAVFGDGGQMGFVEVFDVDAFASTFVYDKKQAVADRIIRMAEVDILTAVVRSAGNVAVVSPRVATILRSLKNSAFNPSSVALVTAGANDGLVEVGTLNDAVRVYRDPWAYVDGGVDYALVAYKGEGVDNAGVIYHPYVINLVNQAVAEVDFGTRIAVMSRYAVTDSLLGSGRYYRYMEFKNLHKIM